MVNAITSLLIVSSLGATSDELLEQIVQNRYKRVAVCPRAVCQISENAAFIGPLGPQAETFSRRLAEGLQAQANNRFEVVPHDEVVAALEGCSFDDLKNPDVLRKLSFEASADAFILVNAFVDGTDSWRLDAELIELETSKTKVKAVEKFYEGISDAAYMGRSFELRRWEGDQLRLVGFDDVIVARDALGLGREYEKRQLEHLKRDLRHPLLDEDVPYGFSVEVDGQKRSLEPIGDKLFVALEPGEEFNIRVWNHSERKIFMGLYVDGVNTINRDHRHPLEAPTPVHWALTAGYEGSIGGWFESAERKWNRFYVARANESVAAGQGITESFGMITAIAYTDGLAGIDAPKEPAKSRDLPGVFGIGAGREEKVDLRFVAGERGIALATMTVYYRTSAELEKMRSLAQK